MKSINVVMGQRSRARHPSKRYAQYQRYAKAYADSREEYERAKRNGAAPSIVAQLAVALKNTENQWDSYGSRERIERALAVYNAVTERDPVITWNTVETEYRDNVKVFGSGRSTANTFTYPDYVDWFSDKEWTVLKDYSPAIEVKRIVIQRPWLDMRVIFSLDWTLLRSAPVDLLSDGQGITKRASHAGPMPLLPVEVIVSRSVNRRDVVQVVAVVSRVVPKLPK
jgi:hypothetical protein